MKLYYIFLALLSVGVNADTPINHPKAIQILDPKSNYCAFVEQNNTTVYQMGCLTGKELYSIKGYHPLSYLRNKGSILISTYSGLNLVGVKNPLETVIFKVYKNGKIQRTVKLKEFITSSKVLTKTASHYHWGHIKYLKNHVFEIETVEGIVLFNYETGIVAK
jgi:hypothetical protein